VAWCVASKVILTCVVVPFSSTVFIGCSEFVSVIKLHDKQALNIHFSNQRNAGFALFSLRQF
jgi:hypothetical protein